ncbi:hypothetical protein PENSPDRAFT_594621 [Peniophora sp. CONT]|nr:hypothetical protein PENSPDRAFT_594621 [Peniophora sp. CONT]
MDPEQTAFAAQYPSASAYGFDIDMMKRPIDTDVGPGSKKARWSPNSFPGNGNGAAQNGALPSAGATSPRDNLNLFANYGYGPQAATALAAASPSSFQPPSSPLYSTSLQTPQTPINPQMSPNTATAFAAAQAQAQAQAQSPTQANGQNNFAFGNFNMLGMGMPGMLNGFPYQAGQMTLNTRLSNFNGLASPLTPSLGGYSGAALAAALGANGAATGRTVYVGNLPASASVDELLNLVHFGPLESVRILPEKSCVFISFLDAQTAAAFHADATIKKLALHNQELKIGWGKPSPVPSQVALAISQSNASRNVYLGGLDENVTEEQLRDDLTRFGLIDQVKIVRDKAIGFVHFLSISVATKVVNTLPTEPAWAGKRVNYGKDRCAYIPKSQQAAAQAAQAAAAQSLVAQSAALSPINTNLNSGMSPFSPFTPFSPEGMALGAQALNRTVYLGNIHPETSPEDLCNAIRGGVLQSIRYMQDKHIAFVTFVDPAAAFTFFQVASYQGLTLNNRRLKIGWGKNSGPLPPALALAVHSGATRNVYVGNIEDFEAFTEDRLKRDFGEYGDIELVNFLKEKNCAFVNYTNISNAIKAIDGIKSKPDYANLRIAHGKDRCANPPRSGPQGGRGRSAGGGPTPIDPTPTDPGALNAAAIAAEEGMAVDEIPITPAQEVATEA